MSIISRRLGFVRKQRLPKMSWGCWPSSTGLFVWMHRRLWRRSTASMFRLRRPLQLQLFTSIQQLPMQGISAFMILKKNEIQINCKTGCPCDNYECDPASSSTIGSTITTTTTTTEPTSTEKSVLVLSSFITGNKHNLVNFQGNIYKKHCF